MSEQVNNVGYTPAWKDEDGNRFIIPIEGLKFDTEVEAAVRGKQLGALVEELYGWQPDGAFWAEKTADGQFAVLAVTCQCLHVTQPLCIAGPRFDVAETELAKQGCANKVAA